MNEIVYFELNNWCAGEDYPAVEPFLTWMNHLLAYFNNENWVKENKLCVVRGMIDMSFNCCITATKEWVDINCPELLTKYKKFLRYSDKDGYVYGQWGNRFLNYEEKNIGIFDTFDEY